MMDELDELEALAADYVLGTLSGAERRQAEARMARDRVFSGLVDDWARRLAPLAEAVPPVEPPNYLWHNIEAALPQRARKPIRSRPAARGFAGLWQQIAFWRWCTLGAAAAASFALFLAIEPQIAPPVEPRAGSEGRYAALLSESGTSPAWLIDVDPAAGELAIRPLGEASPGDKVFELWLIADAETPPRSLGLLEPGAEMVLPVAAGFAETPAGALLAVSLEPPGGSPTGLPTGAVIYQGKVMVLEP